MEVGSMSEYDCREGRCRDMFWEFVYIVVIPGALLFVIVFITSVLMCCSACKRKKTDNLNDETQLMGYNSVRRAFLSLRQLSHNRNTPLLSSRANRNARTASLNLDRDQLYRRGARGTASAPGTLQRLSLQMTNHKNLQQKEKDDIDLRDNEKKVKMYVRRHIDQLNEGKKVLPENLTLVCDLEHSAFLRSGCDDTFKNLEFKSYIEEEIVNIEKMKYNEIDVIINFRKLPQPQLYRFDSFCTFNPIKVIIDQIANRTRPTPHISMRYELLRFCTFKSYLKDNKPFISKLAEAGFYYASDGDGVVCYCCGIRRYNWVEEEIHKRVNPNCKFKKKNEEVNVPVQYYGPYRKALMAIMDIPDLVEKEDRSEAVNTGCAPDRIGSPAASQQNRCSESAANSLGINTAIPKHTQYATKTARVGSYSGWPDTASHNPEVLADAGFFYAGFGDCVRCFYCGIGLHHWMKDDDPWIMHARWSKNCVFVKQMKGEEFVNRVQMAVQQSLENEAQSNSTDLNTETFQYSKYATKTTRLLSAQNSPSAVSPEDAQGQGTKAGLLLLKLEQKKRRKKGN